MDSGELCGNRGLLYMMPILFADSWDTTEHTDMIVSQCEHYSVLAYCFIVHNIPISFM